MRRRIREEGLQGLILAPGPNLRYLTGVNSLLLERPFLLFVPKDEALHLLAPKLEAGPYRKLLPNLSVHEWDDSEGPSKGFEKLVNHVSISGKWGVEGRVPFQFLHNLLKYAQPQLEDAESILQGVREVKDANEVRVLMRATSILSKSFLKLPRMVKPGMTELQLAREFSEEIHSNGAESAEHALIQSGEMSADPHHLASTRKLRRRESIVVDATCTYSGYYADITRTFILGRDRKFEEIYEKVLAAQQAAIKASGRGVPVGSIDEAARSHLRRQGLGQFFIHRTGHGLGLEVHEAPYIVPGGAETIKPSMIFTIEPGAYIPRKIGVRIEDDVLATHHGCRVLTEQVPKEFDWWR